jgi:colanic acid/amylovoran biosynthesis glycosyltransferase
LSKLKVAYLLGTFPQLTQTFVTREIYWIREHDVETHIFSLFNPKSIPTDEQAQGLRPYVRYSPFLSWAVIKAQLYFFHRSPYRYLRALAKTIWHVHREPKMLLYTLALFPKSVYFARQMEGLGIEHIHAHFVTLAAYAASIAAELLGISFTVHAHAVDLFMRDSQDLRRQLENASGVVTISNYNRAHIATLCPRINPDDVDVVYCSLETDRFRPASRQRDNGSINILSVGRLIEKKGFEYLIDACAVLAESGLSFQCQIVGDGPLWEALQARINQHGLQNQVILLGALEQAQVLKLYQESDIFVLACVVAGDGNRDGLPVVLTEAMACQLPVITTPVTGIVDLVEHKRTGLLVRERDILALAEALKCLIEDKKMREQLGQQARQKILQDFQIQRNTAKLADTFRRSVHNYAFNALHNYRQPN